MNKNLSYIGVFKNEAKRMRYILDMAKELCPDMYIAVQPSEDDTLKIAKEYTKNVFELPATAPNYSKDFLAAKVKTDWFCVFDADEILSIPLFNYLNGMDFSMMGDYDAIRIPRINYVNGVICEGGQEKDCQFVVLRKDIRWEPSPVRAIHIYPKVLNHFTITMPYYHIRPFEKIIERTKDWDVIQPDLTEVCHDYVNKVEEELKNYKQKND
jgi:hypothetical protein